LNGLSRDGVRGTSLRISTTVAVAGNARTGAHLADDPADERPHRQSHLFSLTPAFRPVIMAGAKHKPF